jgi:isopropylmalate/homocitrate/citramalate synthase
VTVANCARRGFDGMVAASNVAIAAGAARIDLMDSTSALSPEAMKLFVRAYRGRLAAPVPITMHTHDDFGMATAGTIAAVTAGASPDVSLNGVSYRSGFAALEEVALALEVLYGLDTGIHLDRLQWASARLAEIMDFPVHPLKPVVGAHQFLRDSPGEIMAMLANRNGFPPPGQSVAPALTGGHMQWVWGKQGNLSLLHAIARSLGLALSDDRARKARVELDRRVAGKAAYPRWVPAEEVEAVIRRFAEDANASVRDARVSVEG